MTISIDDSTITEMTIDGDVVREVTMDGDVVWTGKYIYSVSTNQIQKIYATGDKTWMISSYLGAYTLDVAVDPDGYIYIGNDDGYVQKLDSDGNEEWRDSPDGSNVRGVAVDASGNVYAATFDGYIQQYDSSGGLGWNYSLPTNVKAKDITTDGTYVWVSCDRSNIDTTGTVHKINSSGNLEWIFNSFTYPVNAIACDASGNIYAGGNNDNVKKIDSAGNEVWNFTNPTHAIEDMEISNQYIYAVTVDEIYEIDYSGNENWSLTGLSNAERRVTCDADGNFYLSSNDFIIKYDASHNSSSFNNEHDGFIQALASDPGRYGAFSSEW